MGWVCSIIAGIGKMNGGKLKRILILSSDNILSAGIQRLVTREFGYDPVQVSLHDDISNLRECDLDQVSIIILNGSKKSNEMSFLLKLLQFSKELKLIFINVDDNLTQIFEKHEFQIKSSADLCTAIGKP
jgi:hypothetical protein